MSCSEYIYDEGYADFLVDFNYDIDEVYRRFNPDCVNVLNDKYAIFYKDIKKSGVFDSDRFSFNIIPYDSWPKLYALLDDDDDDDDDVFSSSNKLYVDSRHADVLVTSNNKVEFLNNKVVSSSDNGMMDESNSNSLFESVLQETGVSNLRRFEAFGLTGRDVLIGFIDTGINVNLDIFKYEDGRSKVIAIWDQSIKEVGSDMGDFDSSFFEYGRFYDANEINDGIVSGDDSFFMGGMDYNGHGTSLATQAISIAPDSSLVVVKLKEAKNSLKNFYGIEESVLCFSETDVLAGILFLEEIARRENKSMVICLGIGTNQGEHEGKGFVGEVINYLSNSPGIAVVVAGGNEVVKRHHFRGDIFLGESLGSSLGGSFVDLVRGSVDDSVMETYQDSRRDFIRESSIDEVEINVGESVKGFFFEIWTENPNNISIGLVTPTGEIVPRIINNNNNSEDIRFLFDNTSVLVAYDNNVASSGNAVVFIRFINPSEGIWRIQVYKNSLIEGRYDIWLPISGLVNSRLEIVNSNPETTLSQIANASYAITVSGYNHENGGIYVNSSRGYTFDERIKPDVAAPAVEIKSLNNRGNVIADSGTSISSAITSGIVALLFEWGIVNNNYRNMDGIIAKKFLIKGAVKEDGYVYPNKEWGYGKVNIYETFNTYRTY